MIGRLKALALGFLIGVFVAPRSGRASRQLLLERLGEFFDEGSRRLEELENELVGRRRRIGRVARGQADLDDPDVLRDVVDDDVGSRLGLEQDVAHLQQPVVTPQLDATRRQLEIQVGDADEHGSGHARWRRPHGQRDDGLVLAVTPDGQDLDPGVDRRVTPRAQAGAVAGTRTFRPPHCACGTDRAVCNERLEGVWR